jgi:hypothetical protein
MSVFRSVANETLCLFEAFQSAKNHIGKFSITRGRIFGNLPSIPHFRRVMRYDLFLGRKSKSYGFQRSECPRSLLGATRSRTNCFNSFESGKRPWSFFDQITSPSTRTSKMPPVPGMSATSLRSVSKVMSSSSVSHVARNTKRHCAQ